MWKRWSNVIRHLACHPASQVQVSHQILLPTINKYEYNRRWKESGIDISAHWLAYRQRRLGLKKLCKGTQFIQIKCKSVLNIL